MRGVLTVQERGVVAGDRIEVLMGGGRVAGRELSHSCNAMYFASSSRMVYI
jgi:hypothetical protein